MVADQTSRRPRRSGTRRSAILSLGAQRPATMDELRSALEAAGVEFTNGDQPGVRLRKMKSETLLDDRGGRRLPRHSVE